MSIRSCAVCWCLLESTIIYCSRCCSRRRRRRPVRTATNKYTNKVCDEYRFGERISGMPAECHIFVLDTAARGFCWLTTNQQTHLT